MKKKIFHMLTLVIRLPGKLRHMYRPRKARMIPCATPALHNHRYVLPTTPAVSPPVLPYSHCHHCLRRCQPRCDDSELGCSSSSSSVTTSVCHGSCHIRSVGVGVDAGVDVGFGVCGELDWPSSFSSVTASICHGPCHLHRCRCRCQAHQLLFHHCRHSTAFTTAVTSTTCASVGLAVELGVEPD